MRGREASSFPRRLYLSSVATRYPFAAGYTASERQSGHRVGLEPKTFRTGGMHSNHYATSPRLKHILYRVSKSDLKAQL